MPQRGGKSINTFKEFYKKKIKKRYIIPIAVFVAVALLLTTAIIRRKVVTIVENGHPTKYVTYRSTVSQVIKSIHISIGPKDKVAPSLNSRLINNETIILKHAVHINVAVDGKELQVLSAEKDINSMLNAEGIVIRSQDKISPSKDTALSEGMKIQIIRVDTKTITENQSINFKEVVKSNPSLPNTKNQVVRDGQKGEKQIEYSVVYEDGKEVSRKIVGETIIKAPIDKLVIQGSYPLMPVSRGGSIMPYSRVINVKTTAYWAVSGIGRTYTASGRKAVRNPEGFSTVAVDRSLFPYGTKLFIEGYGFAIAADCGTSIIGHKIDVYFNTYKEASHWGAKWAKVYVLK